MSPAAPLVVDGHGYTLKQFYFHTPGENENKEDGTVNAADLLPPAMIIIVLTAC